MSDMLIYYSSLITHQPEKVTLEQADEILLDNMEAFYGKIQEIGYLPEFRKRAKVLPSHW
jgi:hypothetical protein